MPQRRDPVPRARAAGQWLGGILLLGLLGGGVVAAAMLLWENLDVRQLAPGLSVDPGPIPAAQVPAPSAVAPGSFQAVLLNSATNRAFFPDSTYYPDALGRWRRLVEEVGGVVREATSVEDLESLGPQELLVVAEAPCLSRAEASALGAHLDRGGGLVSNWAVGARDERCEWRGWSTVADLTGAGDVRELAVREALYLMVPGGLALSAGFDPGTRIELRPEPTLGLFGDGPRVYWSDWALNPAPDESGGGADVAAVVTRDPTGGRGAWFGFHLSQAATPTDSLRLERLVKNGIVWAAGRMSASISPWPDGRRSTLVLVEDVEAEYANAAAMADLLAELDLPGSFYAVSQLVQEDADLGRTLTQVGEVGSQTSDHTPVAGLPYNDQLVRLRRSLGEIRDWTGSSPKGLRPPEESFDLNTLRAWSEAGGSYVMGVNQARSASPEVFDFGNGEERIVLLPRVMKDDYNVFVQEGALRADRLSTAFLEGMEKLRAIGGLAVVAVHTQIVGTGRRLDAIRDVADRARSHGDWWIATGEEVADWWAGRWDARVEIEAGDGEPVGEAEAAETGEPADEARTADTGEMAGDVEVPDTGEAIAGAVASEGPRILVRGPETRSLHGVWVDVVLPGGIQELIPWVEGVPASYSQTEWGVRVPLPTLAPGQVAVITFSSPPNVGGSSP